MKSRIIVAAVALAARVVGAQCPPFDDSGQWGQGSPIVINFNGGYRLTGADAPVLFDIDATGTPRYIGWTAQGADEAFLWLDRNGNGRVDDGSELFGTATMLLNGMTANNGFIPLAEFDDDADGTISASDRIWPRLLLWRDLNHDGISQVEEITPIDHGRIMAISLSYHWTGRHDRYGNVFRYESQVFFQEEHGPRVTPVYDIFFAPINR